MTDKDLEKVISAVRDATGVTVAVTYDRVYQKHEAWVHIGSFGVNRMIWIGWIPDWSFSGIGPVEQSINKLVCLIEDRRDSGDFQANLMYRHRSPFHDRNVTRDKWQGES